MLEIKPDGGIETGPGPDPGPGISFEMPAHEMCLERRAVLSRLDGQSEYMAFTDGLDLGFMPDVIWIDGRKFKYGGVSDGQGFYREIANPVFAKIARSHVEYFKSAAVPAGDKEPKTDSIHSADCELIIHCYHPDSTCTCRQTSDDAASGTDGYDMIGDDTPVEEFFHAEKYSTEQVLLILKNSGIDIDCGACMTQAFTGSAFAAEHTCPGSESRPGVSVEVHIPVENAAPDPNMQCSRCSEVLDLVSQMIENPPGLSGIRCHLGHVGNHYVDAGWVEALTRVKSYLVTDGSGTREEI